jgi:hypothetical protein
MGAAANALRPFWIQRINGISGPLSTGFTGYLNNGNFLFYGPLSQDNDFELQVSDYSELLAAIAADVDRFGRATVDTVLSIRRVDRRPKAAAWAMIKAYYAAFFAAQAISRLLGLIVTHLQRSEANRLQLIADAQGVLGGYRISAGNYTFSYNTAHSSIKAAIYTGRGGVHALFWREFSSLLERCSEAIISSGNSTDEDRGVALLLDATRSALNTAMNAMWLSDIRNAVNYRHEFGVWFPYPIGEAVADKQFINSKVLESDPLTFTLAVRDATDIDAFATCCSFLVALAMDVLNDLASRHPANRSFVRNGTVASLKLTNT